MHFLRILILPYSYVLLILEVKEDDVTPEDIVFVASEEQLRLIWMSTDRLRNVVGHLMPRKANNEASIHEKYRRDGAVLLKGALNKEELQLVREWYDWFVVNPTSAAHVIKPVDPDGEIRMGARRAAT